jgi:hypothetical protein
MPDLKILTISGNASEASIRARHTSIVWHFSESRFG